MNAIPGISPFERSRLMAKEELIEMRGKVDEMLPDSRYRVSLRLMPGGGSSRRNGAACRALRLFGQGACFAA